MINDTNAPKHSGAPEPDAFEEILIDFLRSAAFKVAGEIRPNQRIVITQMPSTETPDGLVGFRIELREEDNAA
jgi:hypothetical protein